MSHSLLNTNLWANLALKRVSDTSYGSVSARLSLSFQMIYPNAFYGTAGLRLLFSADPAVESATEGQAIFTLAPLVRLPDAV
jgi:hypothetical protein